MKEPAFIPSTGALGTLARDLQFHPSGVTDPKILTAVQVEAFNREGYLTGIPIFDAQEIAGIRHYFRRSAGAHARRGLRQLFHQHRTPALRPRLGSADPPADCGVREGSAGRKRHRMGLSLFL